MSTYQYESANLSLGSETFKAIEISISGEQLRGKGLDCKPVLGKTITFTGWLFKPQILKTKGKQPRKVKVWRMI